MGDQGEFEYLKKVVGTRDKALRIKFPRTWEPDREHGHISLHLMDPSMLTVVNSFHFRDKEAAEKAADYVRGLRGE